MASSPSAPAALTPAHGNALLTMARHTLMRHFGRPIPKDQKDQLANQLKDPALQAPCGTFVTLTIDSQLRGCIGNLTANGPLVAGVRTNAINAALHDPRFDPLTTQELDQVSIEVSVLTEPQPLVYSDAEDLVAKLRPHVDGVTLRQEFSGATFLPQVWEQVPQPEAFLSHLCTKAGWAADTWRQAKLEVQTYQVQSFKEPLSWTP
jgi:AmmeMemoRadiSam system protein A